MSPTTTTVNTVPSLTLAASAPPRSRAPAAARPNAEISHDPERKTKK